MDYLATFLEGIVTFISPCLLPMLPLYIAYFAGDANAAVGAGAQGAARTKRLLLHACGFIAGFTLVFVAEGAFAGAVGRLLVDHGTVVRVVCGLVVIVFGLSYAGFLNVPVLQRTFKPGAERAPQSFASSVLFGIVFAIGWTPCVGVFLGSALALAAVGSSALKGTLLLLCYSAGLALPFLVSTIAIDQLAGAFSAIKRHYRTINRVCGILLVAMGVLMATGLLDSILREAARLLE
ncbi:MAG TPA: cytochrome C biogenesis protein ResB [Eggerthellaceae bacterium]|nr:cytochrome C biogenesis protein ResB [Eggerthellaceae bacterium]